MSGPERAEARYCKTPSTMVPELVRIHPLPACLFIQAKMIPSCLHRMGRLLLAEEIRESVAQHVGWTISDSSLTKQRRDESNNLVYSSMFLYAVL